MLGPVWDPVLMVPIMGCWLMVCWPRHEMLVTGSQNGMLVDGLLVPCMGSGCAGAPAKVYLAYCDQRWWTSICYLLYFMLLTAMTPFTIHFLESVTDSSILLESSMTFLVHQLNQHYTHINQP